MAQVEITKGAKKHVTLICTGTGAASIELNGAAGSAFNVANESIHMLSIKAVAFSSNSGGGGSTPTHWEVRRGGPASNIVGQFVGTGEWHLDEYMTSLSANNLLNAYNVNVNLVGTGAVGTIVLELSKDSTLNVTVP